MRTCVQAILCVRVYRPYCAYCVLSVYMIRRGVLQRESYDKKMLLFLCNISRIYMYTILFCGKLVIV